MSLALTGQVILTPINAAIMHRHGSSLDMWPGSQAQVQNSGSQKRKGEIITVTGKKQKIVILILDLKRVLCDLVGEKHSYVIVL